ncbi:YhgE/Pip domain-containing protein [Streptococcus cuniculipharyngis]|uniref:YhgE/Pip domain-containing protein n=1 Tax=Streptococcus cuniculipharyngis TaxID=1562651 RepID=A0A5C5SB68_9STRE|nr:YhgE/Pip domain-containing protein [Streptococcus cuniculipharyngis]TWS96271.1 YhgE/Pip domain-containing protein [Streptococcus cuniculipharyngis]
MLDEWRAIIKQPILWISMIGLALIPALYNVIFLSSMWDPYGKIAQLPVAVVNQDQPASYQGKTLTVGDDMVDNMSKNKALDYHFVSKKQGEKGLAKGKYFMLITLPKDLSQQAASLLTEEPKQMTISYQTSKGHSFVASKMAESAMTQLKDRVAKNITYTYTNSLFKNVSKLSSGLIKAGEGSQQLAEGSQELEDGSKTLTENLAKLASSSLTFSDGAETLSFGLGQYAAGVTQLHLGLSSLTSGLATYTSGVDSLASGSSQLEARSADLVNGVSQLGSAAEQMQPLVDGANQLRDGLTSLASQVGLSQEQEEQLNQLSQGLEQLNLVIQSLGGSEASLPDVSSELIAISSAAQTLLEAATADSSQTVAKLQASSVYQSLTPDQQGELLAAVGGASETELVSAAQSISHQVASLQSALASLDTGTQATKLTELQASANAVLPGAVTGLASLSTGFTQLKLALTDQLIPGSSQLATGVTTLQSQLGLGASQLQAGVEEYTAAVASISAGANQLSSNSGQLRDGASQLQSGAATLDGTSSQLTSGASQLANGANQLATGADQLSQGGQRLTEGLGSLGTGAVSLSSGLAQANDKLAGVSTDKDNALDLASPVRLSHKDKDKVETNGVGMAPYMMSVALMVAALSSNMIFTKTVSGVAPKNRLDWVSRKLAVNGLVALLSGTILYLAVHLIGVTANHEGKTYFLTLLASLTFMAMVTALYTWHERIGAFASLILLLLQLGSSAGTYPLALTDRFFQSINPFLPMSYTVSGLRQTISMTGQITKEVSVLTVFILVFTALGAGLYTRKRSSE